MTNPPNLVASAALVKAQAVEQRLNALMNAGALGAWQSYTPTWSGFSALGTGFTSSGHYLISGGTCIVNATLTAGTSPSLGTATISFSLPVAAINEGACGTGMVTGSGAFKPLLVSSSGSSANPWGYQNSTTVQLATPGSAGYAWVAGCAMICSLTYQWQ